MAHTIQFELITETKQELLEVDLARTIIAGWTGSNKEAMEAHIVELEELGVKRPVRTPMFYRVSTSRITQDPRIEVIGGASSGEVEYFLINIKNEIWVGVGSDHTDREAETQGVTLSKQMCDKPVSRQLWRLDDVKDHWEKLKLRSHISSDSNELILYQEGPVTSMLMPNDLLQRFVNEDSAGGLCEGDLMMCGTLAAIGGVRAASTFEFELVDPVLTRSIKHRYEIHELLIEG